MTTPVLNQKSSERNNVYTRESHFGSRATKEICSISFFLGHCALWFRSSCPRLLNPVDSLNPETLMLFSIPALLSTIQKTCNLQCGAPAVPSGSQKMQKP